MQNTIKKSLIRGTHLNTAAFNFPESLKSSLRKLSQDKMSLHFGQPEIKLSDYTNSPLVLANWMSLVLLANSELRLVFKAHYNTRDVQSLSNTFNLKTSGANQVPDFMKEFCNLVGGSYKALFSENAWQIGLSLPLVVRGFDEVFNLDAQQAEVIKDRWVLSADDARIICEVKIDILSSSARDQLGNIKEVADSSGDIEFL